MKLRPTLILPAPLFLLLACGESAPTTGDGQFATESGPTEVRFELTGEIRGAPGTGNGAKQNWTIACERWAATLRELAAPAEVASVECGSTSQSSADGQVQLGSVATAIIVAKLSAGAEPLSFQPGEVYGPSGAGFGAATAGWIDQCEASLRHAKETYGARLLGGACGTPLPVPAGANVGYRSPLTLWVAPVAGETFTLEGFAQGSDTTPAGAHAAWRASCDAWLARTEQLTWGNWLGVYSCGERKSVSTGATWAYESRPSLEIVVRLTEPGSATSETFTTTGDVQTTPSAAKALAIAACEGELAIREQTHGPRFLAGSCASPTAVLSSSGSQYKVTGTFLLGDVAPVSEPSDPDGTEPPGSDPATDCTSRCLEMVDACNADPRDQICALVCNAEPSEAELACAEQVDCQHIEDWFDVCGLGA